LLVFVLFLGCTQVTPNEPLEEIPANIVVAPAIEDIEEPEIAVITGSLPFASDFHLPANIEIFEKAQDVIKEVIQLRQGWWDTSNGIIVQWNSDGIARVSDSRGASGVFFMDNYMIGRTYGLGSVTFSVNLETLERSEREIYDIGMVRLSDQAFAVFANGFLAFRPQLINRYIEPLTMQLQFDFGEDLGYHLGYEYLILSLTYNPSNQTYVAVYSPNPYAHPIANVNWWDSVYGWKSFDNSACELRIAIFDERGGLTETFALNGVVNPIATGASGGHRLTYNFPILFILGENTALLIPQEYPIPGDGRYDSFLLPQEEFLLPIEINLTTQAHRRWSEDEVNAFLQNDKRFELSMEGFGHQLWIEQIKEPGWSASENPLFIQERRIPHHIESVLTNESLLIFVDGDETPLFAVPSELALRLYHQTEDGTRYFIFSL